ncbi:hypothetical protein E8E14_004085 [Neopestalotiopsis sp. 37M]|nr:hypothetical protein E8E14_004085 [Neopestalotiopsis sp. 37M]
MPRQDRLRRAERKARAAMRIFRAPRPHPQGCMSCWRTATKNFSSASLTAVAPLCVFESAAVQRCKQCAKRNRSCEQAAAGMAGDMNDLVSAMGFTANFQQHAWDAQGDPIFDAEGRPVLVFPEEIRSRVAAASLRLAVSFEASEKAHRAEHNVTAAKKETKDERDSYRSFVNGRLAGLRANGPRHPGLNADAELLRK